MDELVEVALGRVNENVKQIPWEEIKKYKDAHTLDAYNVDFRSYIAKALRSVSVLYEALKAI